MITKKAVSVLGVFLFSTVSIAQSKNLEEQCDKVRTQAVEIIKIELYLPLAEDANTYIRSLTPKAYSAIQILRSAIAAIHDANSELKKINPYTHPKKYYETTERIKEIKAAANAADEEVFQELVSGSSKTSLKVSYKPYAEGRQTPALNFAYKSQEDVIITANLLGEMDFHNERWLVREITEKMVIGAYSACREIPSHLSFDAYLISVPSEFEGVKGMN